MGHNIDATNTSHDRIKAGKGRVYEIETSWEYLKQPLWTRRHLKVIIMGFGMAGIEMAYKLSRESPETEFVVYEKSAKVGGTWNHNTYPGVGCDSPTVSYQFAWNLNPHWKKVYADGDEIQRYFESTVEKFGLLKNVRLRHEVTNAVWQDDTGKWVVDVTAPDGSKFQDVGDILLGFTGNIHNIYWPNLKNRENCKATVVHTGQWPKGLDWADKRVAIIGNGSSAVQVAPAIIGTVTKLDLYQRTPAWILPKFKTASGALGKLLSNATIDQVDGHYTAEQTQKFIDDPEYYYRIVRGSDATLSKNLMSVLKKGSPGQVAIRQATLEYMQNTIRDPKLREALIPTFELNCRRVAPNDDYLEALQHPNASVITKPIKAFTENGLELEDGSTPEYDIIICATGYDNSFRPHFPIVGKNGITLQKAWEVTPEAFLGLVTSGFPNYYFALGPNAPLSNGSASAIIAVLVNYVMKVVEKMERDQIKSLEFRRDRLKSWNDQVQSLMPDFVWTGACNSWYKNHKTGRVTAPYPGSMLHYALVGQEPRYEDYEIEYDHANPYAFYGNGWPIGEAEGTIEDPVPYFRHPSKYLP